jgi:hypothetical protein
MSYTISLYRKIEAHIMKKISAKFGLKVGLASLLIAVVSAGIYAMGIGAARWVVYVSVISGVVTIFILLIAKITGSLENDLE